jgi:hypothetical protein
MVIPTPVIHSAQATNDISSQAYCDSLLFSRRSPYLNAAFFADLIDGTLH